MQKEKEIGIMIQEHQIMTAVHDGYLLVCDNCVRGNQAS